LHHWVNAGEFGQEDEFAVGTPLKTNSMFVVAAAVLAKAVVAANTVAVMSE
jgi:hypothetical protein